MSLGVCGVQNMEPSCLILHAMDLGVKGLERDAEYPPHSDGLLIVGRYTSASPLCLHRHVMGRPLPFVRLVIF